ncbi:hypothetical protein M8J76_016018 [Diaphorina citri]|nr:hypothetical protein M8J76_016018 [Diaphorina citri]
MVIQLGLGIQATQAIFDPPRVVLDSRDRQNLSFKAARLKFTTTQQPSVSRRFGLGIQALQRSILDSMEPPRVVLDSKQHQNLSFEATPLKFTTQRAVSEGNPCKSQIQPSRLKCSHLLWRFWNPTNCLSLKANSTVFQEIVPGKSKFCLVGTMRFVSLCQQLMYSGYLFRKCRENRYSALSEPCDFVSCVSDLLWPFRKCWGPPRVLVSCLFNSPLDFSFLAIFK